MILHFPSVLHVPRAIASRSLRVVTSYSSGGYITWPPGGALYHVHTNQRRISFKSILICPENAARKKISITTHLIFSFSPLIKHFVRNKTRFLTYFEESDQKTENKWCF